MEKDNPDVLASTVPVQCPGLSKLLLTVLFLCAAVCCQDLALWLPFLVSLSLGTILFPGVPQCAGGLSQRWRDRRPRAALAWAWSTLLHQGAGWVPSTCSPFLAILAKGCCHWREEAGGQPKTTRWCCASECRTRWTWRSQWS